jgi:hypothetical protein
MKFAAAPREGPARCTGSSPLTKLCPAHGSARNWPRRSSPEAARSPILTTFAPSKNNLILPHQRDHASPIDMRLSIGKP